MADFVMPSLGADMDEGTLLEWLIKPGDQVHRGEAIAVVDTAKAAIEVESFADGTVEALIVEPGQTVPVGTVLAKIIETAAHEAPPALPIAAARSAPPVSADGAAPAAAAAAPAAKSAKGRGGRASAKRTQPTAARKMATAAGPPQGRIGVPQPGQAPTETGSPLVRHLARDLGVDLATVHGTGHAGTVTRADVQHAARSRTPRPPRASPRARQVAAELSVDLAAVTGTGPGGAIRESDVRRAARPAQTAASPASSQARSDRLAAMRQATARLMARSKREIPHYYLSSTVDLTTAMAWLHDRNRETDVAHRLVPAALLLKAAALAARTVPELNGFWVDDQFVPADGVHLGVAVSLRGGGLITPAIHDAADLEPAELMHRLRDLVTRARTGRLRGSELTGGTVTVTNLGDQGVESVHGVIYPPQVALVGFGKVAERPVAVGGLIGARPTVIATLAADHRATDGYTGARYLNTLSDLLQQPEEL